MYDIMIDKQSRSNMQTCSVDMRDGKITQETDRSLDTTRLMFSSLSDKNLAVDGC